MAVTKKAVTKKTAAKKTLKASTAVKSDVAKYADFEPYQTKKGEEYMGEAQLAHFREILLAWKRGLMEEVDRTVHHMKDEVTNFPDPNDRATQEEEFSLELRTRDRERKLIKKIDESLEQIDNEEYGYCEACGVEIGIRRLEARPTATMCIDCKTLEEIKEKQTRI
ncbi:MAG: RNA polymerase-binding protein DksA [Gammaproteobacteria bacterium]|nr:RNA polymerase-binding protein DksA [Gammaproteobacteria bacterium]